MKADKTRELDTNELQKQVKDLPEQMFRLKFQMSMGQADGLTKLRAMRKDRARILTILRERELHPETAPAPKSEKKTGKKTEKKRGQ